MPVNMNGLNNQWYQGQKQADTKDGTQIQVDKSGDGQIDMKEMFDKTVDSAKTPAEQQTMEQALSGKLVHSTKAGNENYFQKISRLDKEDIGQKNELGEDNTKRMSAKELSMLAALDGNAEELSGADFDKLDEMA